MVQHDIMPGHAMVSRHAREALANATVHERCKLAIDCNGLDTAPQQLETSLCPLGKGAGEELD